MDKLYKDIFGEPVGLSQKQIEAYLNNTLSDAERNEVERIAASSEFEAEALEGFENTPESSHLLKKLAFQTPVSKASSFNWKIIVPAIAASLVGVFFILQSNFKPQDSNPSIAEQTTAPSEPIIESTLDQSNELTDTTPLAENTNPEPQKEEQKGKLREQQNFPKQKKREENKPANESAVKSEEQSSVDDGSSLASNQSIDIQETQTTFNNNSSPTTAAWTSNTSNADYVLVTESIEEPVGNNSEESSKTDPLSLCNEPGMKCVDGYLVVNYDSVNREPKSWSEKNKSLTPPTGLDPMFESENNLKSKQIEGYKITRSYNDVLQEGIYAFRKNQFRESLTTFDLILKSYPDDKNALMYSGLAFVEIGNADQALQRFLSIQEPSPSFKEIIDWNIAQIYFEQGKEQGTHLLDSISQSTSFYNKQAQFILNKSR